VVEASSPAGGEGGLFVEQGSAFGAAKRDGIGTVILKGFIMVMDATFMFDVATLPDLHPIEVEDHHGGPGKVQEVEIHGRPLKPTGRFWKSLYQRFGFSGETFRYFTRREVFERVAGRLGDTTFRYCVERRPGAPDKLLAVSSLRRNLVHPGELSDLVLRYGGEHLRYEEGRLTSVHTPRSGTMAVPIGKEEFQNRFVLEVPVDGFGPSRTYVSLLRLICSNGMVGYSPAFRSEIRIGEDVLYSLERALANFENDEGYSAFYQRLESARTSLASVREIQALYRVLRRPHVASESPADAITRLDRLAGDVQVRYGLSNLEAVSVKRQRLMPVDCTVYDVLNFVSEIATYHAGPAASRALYGHLGSLVSDVYDLEGTARDGRDFQDFFWARDVK
jgi:hypothetical protein